MIRNSIKMGSGIFLSHKFLPLLKTLVCLFTVPQCHSFVFHKTSILKPQQFELVARKWEGKCKHSKIFLSLDTTELAITTLQPTIDITSDDSLISSPILSTLLPTMYAAMSGAAKHSQQWSFLWFHGGTVDPFINGHSIAPADLGKIEQVQDFFTPNSISEASKSLGSLHKNMDALSTGRNSADFIRINPVLPGAPRSLQDPQTYEYNTKIDKREIETIALHFDLVMKKIPLAVTIFALVDFFGFGGNNVLSTELDENRPKAAVDWVVQSSIRVGIAVLVVWATVLVSKFTYHPI